MIRFAKRLSAKARGWTDDASAIVLRLALAAALAVIYAALAAGLSRGLEVNRVTAAVDGLPATLNGLRVAHLSDLHSSRFGEGQNELIAAVAGFQPDVIVLTGDIMDGTANPDIAPCLELSRGLAQLAPVYWVRGNHEYYLDGGVRAEFVAGMKAQGAVLLDNESAVLEHNGAQVLLTGMDDVRRFPERPDLSLDEREDLAFRQASGFLDDIRRTLPPGDYPLRIMLCHQPHWWSLWKDAGYDLALCGHLHGWVVRVPDIGGLLRNPIKFFPEEDAGLYDKQGLRVYINRGLDNLWSLKNLRMNNRPELALITVSSAFR